MMRQFVGAGVMAAVFGLAAGCGSDSPETPPDPLATHAGFCEEWAAEACNEEVVNACASASREACLNRQAQFCATVVPATAYRRDAADDCLDAVGAAYADARLSGEEVAVVLRSGAPCDFACVMVDGECIEPTVIGGGEECGAVATVCEEGFYCDGNNCLARRSEGRSCSEEIPCVEDLRCVGEAGAMTCVAKSPTGQACTEDADCLSGICTVPAGETEGICIAELILSAAEPVCSDLR